METIDKLFDSLAHFVALSWTKMALIATLLLFGFLLRKLFSKAIIFFVRKTLGPAKDSSQQDFLVALVRPLSLTFIIGAFYLSGIVADMPKGIDEFYETFLKTMITFTFFWGLYSVIDPIAHMTGKTRLASVSIEVREFLAKVLEMLTAILGILSILQIWGVNVAAFLAGLGLFGMAIAFAAQDTIKNFFGCVAILMDKTFQRGHWIKTKDVEGTVEKIGFRTTAVRQFDKALVHIPNAKLADAAVINFAKMTNRRVRWIIGLTYGTPADVLERIVVRIREFLEEHPDIETDPNRVTTIINLDKFSDSSIDIFCYFFTRTIKWTEYMHIKEDCLLAIKRIVEEEGSSFAFPTQSVHIESLNMDEEKPQTKLHKKKKTAVKKEA